MRITFASSVYFKEIRQIAQNKRTFVFKCLFLGLLFLTVVVVYLNAPNSSRNPAASFSTRGELGSVLFWSMSYVSLAVALLFTPMFTAGVVCGEREADTLGLLFLTRLTSWNIIQDKGLSRITLMVWTGSLTVPFYFAALLFGGVETWQIIGVWSSLLGTALQCGGLALFFSTVTRGYAAALACTYAAMFGFYVLATLLIGFVWFELLGGGPPFIIAWFNPFFAMILSQSPYQLNRYPALKYAWVGILSSGVACYLLSVAIGSLLLRRLHQRDKSTDKRWSLWRIVRNMVSMPFYLVARIFHRYGKRIHSPVFWKESNVLLDSVKFTFHVIALLLGMSGIVAVGLFLLSSNNDLDAFLMICYLLGFPLVALMVGILFAVAFTKEKTRNQFDLLLSTRLSGWQIVLGTYWGTVRSSLFPVLILLSPLLALTAGNLISEPLSFIGIKARRHFGEVEFICVLLSMVNTAVYMNFLAAVGLTASLHSQNGMKACAWTFGAMLALALGLPLLSIPFEPGRNELGAFLLAASPATWIFVSAWENPADFLDPPMYFINIGCYAMATAAMLLRLACRFDRVVGRQGKGYTTPIHPRTTGETG